MDADPDKAARERKAVLAMRILFDALAKKYKGDKYTAVVKLCDEILGINSAGQG